MDIILWRHAEAEDGIPDIKRKLTPRGEKQAQQMAAWLATHAPENLRIIASPARRCQQTVQALGRPFDTDPRLAPGRSAVDLLAAIDWPDGPAPKTPAIVVVGHQPTLGRTAALLLAGSEADWSIKKGAVWWFSNRTRDGETQTVLRAVVPAEVA
jgi:phosphohistidine phosphatase